jgi:hypothetical protein
MNPAPNHGPTEGGYEIWGNTMPDFRYYEVLNRNSRPRQIRDRDNAERDGRNTPQLDTFYPTFRQQEPRRYENHGRSSSDIDVGPELSEESKPLFPEARNSGKFPCWISRIIGNSSCWTESLKTLNSLGRTEFTLCVLQSQISNAIKIRPVGAELFLKTDRQTDLQT